MHPLPHHPDTAPPQGHDAAALCTPQARPWVLVNSILASGMVFIDGTVVNVALPALQQAFDSGVAGAQWVVEAYALLLTALLLLGGAMGDRYGRRRVFAGGVLVFGAASVCCGLAQTIGQLIWARALQGAGGALLVPGSLALISAAFPQQLRGKAIGTWSGWTAITAAVGLALAGGVVDRHGARLPLVLGPAIAAAGFAAFMLPGVGGSYWTTFFPAILVLGVGMAVTVAPLTTTVMNALDAVHAGLASGVNNAVARAAGLLAIALLGIVLQRACDAELERRIAAARLPAALRLQLATQRGKLAAPTLPPATAPAERARVEDAVAGAFVHGFRWVMGIAALPALGSAGSAWAMLGRRRTR